MSVADDILKDAIERAFREWQEIYGMENPAVPVAYVVIVEGGGFSPEGENVEQVMIVPGGSRPHVMGLLKHAEARFQAETMSYFLGRGGE